MTFNLNRDKEHQVSALILGQNKTFLVDAKRVGDTFKWSNGKEFQPLCVDCVQHSTGLLNCYFLLNNK